MKKLSILTLGLLSMLIQSCISTNNLKFTNVTSLVSQADEAFHLYEFFTASILYKSLYSKSKDNGMKFYAAHKSGICYLKMSNYSKAELWFKKASIKNPTDKDNLFLYAESLRMQGKYEEAKQQFTMLNREYPGDDKPLDILKYIDSSLNWQKEESIFIVEKAKFLNSKENDYAPYPYKDNSIIFTSDRKDKNKKFFKWNGYSFTDIYIAEYDKRKDKYSLPTPIADLNTSFNDGVVCYNKKYNEIYFTQCNGNNGKLDHCRIMVSKKKGQDWILPVELPFCNDSFANYGQPTISPNGKMMIFSSNMLGGLGEIRDDGNTMKTTDLYVSFKVSKGRTWSDPVNLGETINTPENDQFPFLYKNNELYFSSSGHQGMGGLDIFKCSKKEGEWSKPVNLQYPLNSPGDDFGIYIFPNGNYYDGYKGYLSSNRDGKTGDDIYEFHSLPIVFNLAGTVFDSKTKEIVANAEISVYNNVKDTTVKITTDANGHYEYKNLGRKTDYDIQAFKDGYFASEYEYASTFGLRASTDFVRDLYLDPFPSDEEIFELEGIFYGLDSANINEKSAEILTKLAYNLKRYPNIVLELRSHTDCRADSSYNMKLSQRRADSCVAFLVKKGIEPERLVAKGYGENVLLTPCPCEGPIISGLNCSEKEHAMNRRTEIKILRKDFGLN